jgi:hypothetical protein
MAVAPDESPVHIGVFAWSADDARNRFFKARSEWHILLEEALAEAVADANSKKHVTGDRSREPAIS